MVQGAMEEVLALGAYAEAVQSVLEALLDPPPEPSQEDGMASAADLQVAINK